MSAKRGRRRAWSATGKSRQKHSRRRSRAGILLQCLCPQVRTFEKFSNVRCRPTDVTTSLSIGKLYMIERPGVASAKLDRGK